MGKFDTTVTTEELERRNDGNIRRFKLSMGRGDATYIVRCKVEDGELSFGRVSPVRRSGNNITSGAPSLFSTNVQMMDVEKTLSVMRAAKDYVDENYPEITVPRSLWLNRYRRDQ